METTNDANPPPTPSAPGRRLTRSTGDKVFAGVCGGLGQYFNLDPVIFRIAFVVLALAGGTGVAMYLLGWLLIPDDRSTGTPLDRLGEGRLAKLLAAVLVACAVLLLLDELFWHDRGDPPLALLLLAVGAGVLWLRRRETGGQPAPPPEGPPPSPSPPAAGPTGSPPGEPVPPADVPPAADSAAGAAATGSTFAGTSIATADRPPSVLTPLTLSVLALVGGLLALLDATGAVDVSPAAGLAFLLLLTGGALIVGAWRGRARWLIPVGLVLCCALATLTLIDVPLRGGAGDRLYQPTTVAELRSPYRLAAGEMVLDLSDLELAGTTRRVVASVGTGSLLVLLPADAAVAVDAHVGVGELEILGRTSGGVDVGRSVGRLGREGTGRLIVRARVGLGQVEVRRAAA